MILTKNEWRRVRAVRERLNELALLRHGVALDSEPPTMGVCIARYSVRLHRRTIGYLILRQEDSRWWPIGIGGTAFVNQMAVRRSYASPLRAALAFAEVRQLYGKILNGGFGNERTTDR